MKRIILAFALLFMVAGCVSGGPTLTPAQARFDLGQRYLEVSEVVLRYVSLPLCTPEAFARGTRCAREDAVRALQEADDVMYLLLVHPDTTLAIAATGLRTLRAVLVRYAVKEVLR